MPAVQRLRRGRNQLTKEKLGGLAVIPMRLQLMTATVPLLGGVPSSPVTSGVGGALPLGIS